MFTWINKQGVEKDEDFRFQRIDRFHYEYSDINGDIKISIDPSSSIYDIYLSDAIGSLLDENGRLIAENVREALEFMGHKFRII